MAIQAQPTPVPWDYENMLKILRVGPDLWADHTRDEANAEFIVRACNAHDYLVEAAERVVYFFRESNKPYWNPAYSELEGVLRIALAKAQQKVVR